MTPHTVQGLAILAATLTGVAFVPIIGRVLRVRPAPARDPDLRPAVLGSPAVVSLLVHRGRVTAAAADATLLDLVDRGIIAAYGSNGGGPAAVRVRDPRPAGLRDHEELVLRRVVEAAGTGTVAVTGLAFGDTRRWRRLFTLHVNEAARGPGLTRSGLLERALPAGAAVLAATFTLLVLSVAWPRQYVLLFGGLALWGQYTVGVMLMIATLRTPPDRYTRAGREAAARALAVRDLLRERPTILLERGRAYATALGVVPSHDHFGFKRG